jgi:hypothetical protein
MNIIHHKFPAGLSAFGVIQPPTPGPLSKKLVQIKVVDPKDPGIYCIADIVEILIFNISGQFNEFPDWLSLVLFGMYADPLLVHLQKRYPQAKQQNSFEIWIAKKSGSSAAPAAESESAISKTEVQ